MFENTVSRSSLESNNKRISTSYLPKQKIVDMLYRRYTLEEMRDIAYYILEYTGDKAPNNTLEIPTL